jgi:dihydrofolate synthase/folylpolyglutamate synthase
VGKEVVLDPLQHPSLMGSFQIRNAAGVLALVEAMGDQDLLTKVNVNAALGSVSVPGRCQVIERKRRWIVDVAHNADAARVLAIALREMEVEGGMTCIIGVLNDKDIPGLLDPLLPLVDNWVAVSAGGPRAVPAEELGRVVANIADKPCLLADSVSNACAAVSNDQFDSNAVLVTGSFMTIGPALQWLQQNPDSDKR